MPDKVKVKALVETGFPWRPLLVGLAVLLGGIASGLGLGYPLTSVSVVSILGALAVFSALLGWGTQSRD